MKRTTSPLIFPVLAGLLAFSAPVMAEQMSTLPAGDAAAASAAPASKAEARAQARAERSTARGASYYVEFRSRYALSYGHTFLVHGRLGPGGRIITSEVAGLHPAGDDPGPWMVGHFLPVPSETGASDGDTESQYISARYRINLTAEQYQKVSAYIRRLQSSSPMWHAVLYNCNAFVGDVAHFMGLKTPGTLAMPAEYINGIRSMNGGVSRVSLPGDGQISGSAMLQDAPR